MILTVLQHPDKNLKTRSTEVAPEELRDENLQKLIDDMFETMRKENGVGLAAPQVGVNKRIIVVDDGTGEKAYLNPIIIRTSFRKADSEEGCLSVKGVWGIVRRYKSVKATAQDRDGKIVKINAHGLMAIILQHEIDHIDGTLFIDRVKEYTNRQQL